MNLVPETEARWASVTYVPVAYPVLLLCEACVLLLDINGVVDSVSPDPQLSA